MDFEEGIFLREIDEEYEEGKVAILTTDSSGHGCANSLSVVETCHTLQSSSKDCSSQEKIKRKYLKRSIAKFLHSSLTKKKK